jgi:hypothetical protein
MINQENVFVCKSLFLFFARVFATESRTKGLVKDFGINFYEEMLSVIEFPLLSLR